MFTIQSNLYIKGTEGNLQVWLYINVYYSIKPVYKGHWRDPSGLIVFAILLIHVKFSEVFQLEKLYNNVFNIELSNLNATDIPP